jgi:hypothetical protein
MKEIGFVVAAIGALLLGYFGLVGQDSGLDGFRVVNFGGMLVGSALLISGSIFAASGVILEQLRSMSFEGLARNIRTADSTAQTQDRSNVVSASTDGVVKNYRGYPIRKAHDWASTGEFLVGDAKVRGIIAAEQHIDRLLDGKK